MRRKTFRVTVAYDVSIPTSVLILDDMTPAGIAAYMERNAAEDFADFWDYFMKGESPSAVLSVEPK